MLLLAFKVVVIVPLIAAFRRYWGLVRARSLAATDGASLGDGPLRHPPGRAG